MNEQRVDVVFAQLVPRRHPSTSDILQPKNNRQPRSLVLLVLSGAPIAHCTGRSGVEFILSGQSSYWRLRAEETRVLAETMTTNLHAYGAMLRIADEYERLADMADRENTRNAPVEALPETS
jgi:hypothetical protein